jgi:hypothetical protein
MVSLLISLDDTTAPPVNCNCIVGTNMLAMTSSITRYLLLVCIPLTG